MKNLVLLLITLAMHTTQAQINFTNYTPYTGTDLGVTYTKTKTTFKVWSPAMDNMVLRLYHSGVGGAAFKTINFTKKANHIFEAIVTTDLNNIFYTYQGSNATTTFAEVPDIYAKAVGVNGQRGMVVNMQQTNPPNWATDKNPFTGTLNQAIIYELHVRDATLNTQAKHKGKFLGLTQTGLTNSFGQPVGIDHLKQLGITHVQLLPSYDFFTINETKLDSAQYNWGYDPLNYNTPEGSYSTNPYNGATRIKEFKQLIQTLHKNGIAVIMDVVYNHTMFTEQSYFNQLVPNYYYRQNTTNGFSNASACGNETASERPMARKFMLESVLHWLTEYHIDGFRFDLMAIHDIKTMNQIATAVRKIKPNAILLGEGWTAGQSPLPDTQKALKINANKLNNIAVFSDDIRDAIKGSVFEHKDTGVITGKLTEIESIKFGLVGGIQHPQINYANVNYAKAPYTNNPSQLIAYNECHDNHTLWDRLINSQPNDEDATRQKRYNLGMAIVLTTQGVPFIHAGQEFCRTKQGVENSYKSPDSINAINWDRLHQFNQMHKNIVALIALRKKLQAFNLGSASAVQKQVSFTQPQPSVLHMQIKTNNNTVHVFYNFGSNTQVANFGSNNNTTLLYHTIGSSNTTNLEALSCKIFIQ
jgi:pullulanase